MSNSNFIDVNLDNEPLANFVQKEKNIYQQSIDCLQPNEGTDFIP
jgi:hypothetical protein